VTAPRLLLVRHGRTAYNAGARLQGQVDIPLDDVGRWQARTASALLLARHTPTRIVASDLSRALETAQLLGRAAGVDVETDVRLRERGFGIWEGMTGDEISARWPDEFAVWRTGGEPTGVGAETRSEVSARAGVALDELTADLGRDETLVVVSHGSAITSMVATLLGLDPGSHAFAGMHNVHWADLVRSAPGRDPAWRLLGYNLGPTDASSDWNAGPDIRRESDQDAETRDPD